MSTDRIHYCSNCRKETKQFKQFNIGFEIVSDEFVWHCRLCNKNVTKVSETELRNAFKRNDLDNLIGHIAQYFKVHIADIKSNKKEPTIVLAKHLFSYMALYFNYGSTREVGKFLKRPHTTVQLGRSVIAENFHKPQISSHFYAIENIILNTDKVQLFRKILQNTPVRQLPNLIDYINQFQLSEATTN